jgi:hypothetical protein
MRTKAQHEAEKKIVEDLKKIDLRIKKLEKEDKSLEKIITGKDLFEEEPGDDEERRE